MAHWAEIDENNKVIRVAIGSNEEPDEGESFFINVLGGTWIQASINTTGGIHYTGELDENGNRIPSETQTKALRKNYPGIGFTYDEERDAFIPPKPFESWLLNEDTCLWEAPVAYPEDGNAYTWDEESGAWVAVPEDTVE